MSTNCTAVVSAVALTSLLITTPSAFAIDAGDADLDATTLELIRQYDEALLPPEDHDNAAVRYREAIDALGSARITSDEWLLEGSSPTDSLNWDPRLARSILAKSAGAIGLAREAAQLPWAEFGIDRSRGRNVLLPHLTPLRRLSRLMAMQVRALRTEGRDAEAHELLVDICSLSQHTASDRLPVASLAASACSLQAIQGIDEAIALGAISKDQAKQLRATLGSTHDPFNYADAVLGERDLIIPWLQSNPETALAELGLSSGTIHGDNLGAFLADGESFNEALDALSHGFDRVHAILRVEDPTIARTMLAEFKQALSEGAFGELGAHLLLNHPRVVRVKLDMQERIGVIDASLREIQLGADPITFANAATLYAFAFPHVKHLDSEAQDTLETVRRYAAVVGSTKGLPREAILRAQKVLARLTPARQLVARATWCDTCTWKRAEDAERLSFAIGEGEWVRPMRALARIRLVEAVLALEDGRPADANLAIADALAVGLHLADGSHLLGSVVGSATLNEVAEIARIAEVNGTFANDSRAHALFEQRLQRFDPSDPLAWRAGRSAMMRVQLVEHLANRFNLDSTIAARRLVACDNDRLASIGYLLVDGDLQLFEYRFEREPNTKDDVLLSLADIIVLEARTGDRLRAARRHLDQVLMIVDDTRPIAAMTWHERGLEAVESIQEAVMRARPSRLATVPELE